MRFAFARAYIRAAWVRLPWTVGLLSFLLQRSPWIQVVSKFNSAGKLTPAIRIIQKIAVPAAALGAPHAVSGASESTYRVQYDNETRTAKSTTNPRISISLQQGIATAAGFSITITPRSWEITGPVPSGMQVTDIFGSGIELEDGLLATDFGAFLGTPTSPGTFELILMPWENSDGTGTGPPNPLHLTIVVTEADTPSDAPALALAIVEEGLRISWTPDEPNNFILHTSSDLAIWNPVDAQPSVSDGVASVTLSLAQGLNMFYQLQ